MAVFVPSTQRRLARDVCDVRLVREAAGCFDVIRVHELDGHAAQHLLTRIAEHFFVAGIDVGEMLVAVELGDEVEGALGECTEALLTPLQLGFGAVLEVREMVSVAVDREVNLHRQAHHHQRDPERADRHAEPGAQHVAEGGE